MVKLIYLTQGRAAIVDDEDYKFLNQFLWIASKGTATYYARKQFTDPETDRNATIQMHRLIMERMLEENGDFRLLEKFQNNPRKYLIDHINGHGLCNLRKNLRIVTSRQNQQNQHRVSSSRYPGVYFHKHKQKWATRIRIGNKRKWLGLFKTEQEAFLAYKNAVHELTGEKVVCELGGGSV